MGNCHTLILFGDDHSQTFGFLLAELSCLTQVVVQSARFFDILEKIVENTQKGTQNGHFVTFSSPWLD